jgi:UDP-N-acetylmuramyl pentapeptide phosphotransferase/UDP-N-acetylglucosamine-1-phosphate transferase
VSEFWATSAGLLSAIILMPLVIGRAYVDRCHVGGPQQIHRRPISRLAGEIMFLAYMTGAAVSVWLGNLTLVPATAVLIAALPVLVAGLYEDATGRLSPNHRLGAALASALLAATIAGGLVARLDLPLVDRLLEYRILTFAVTCFMVVGACNAMNLIDGAHGLAGGTAIVMFVGLAIAAAGAGDGFVFAEAIVMAAVVAGFLLWNFPRGRVFMGDGGAYFIGFMYAQLSMQLVVRNDGIGAWFVVMVAAYPIVETVYSIYRRRIQLRAPSMQPDALHLHSLIYDRIALPLEESVRDGNLDHANAGVAPRLWVHSIACVLFALAFRDNSGVLMMGLVGYALFYHWLYRTLVRLPHRKVYRFVGRPAALFRSSGRA